MKIFALDLGSIRTGWAYFDGPSLLSVGVWELTSRRQESWGVRWLRLTQLLGDVNTVSRLEIDLVAFEEVRRHQGVDAAHAYGAAKGVLLAWCELQRLEFCSVPIAALKRAAVNKGGGSGTGKKEVLAAARERWPHHKFKTDDASDAAFVGLAALRTFES